MVGVNGTNPQLSAPSPEQLRYARVLDYGMKIGLIALIAGFLAYVAGIAPARVPLEELPRFWGLPVLDYLRETGVTGGWGWLAAPGSGDALAFAGIAVLAGASLPCLLALVPLYAARKDWTYLVITLLLSGVLTLAASGVLVSH